MKEMMLSPSVAPAASLHHHPIPLKIQQLKRIASSLGRSHMNHPAHLNEFWE
jgi:hypothetical protein